MALETNEDGPLPELTDPYKRSSWNMFGRLKDWAGQQIRALVTEKNSGIPPDLQSEISEGELLALRKEFRDALDDMQRIYARQNGGVVPDPHTAEQMRGTILLSLMKKFGIDPKSDVGHFLFSIYGTFEFGIRHRKESPVVVDTNTGMIL